MRTTGRVTILRDVSFTIEPGEVVCLMGRNGVGKTTTLKTLTGLLPVRSGTISFVGQDITHAKTDRRAKVGLAYVPQGGSLVSGSRLTIASAGTYNIQFSAQIETSAGADTAYVWFKQNGTNIGDSATKVVLANNTAQVTTVNILDEASANDYYELGYQFTNGNATVLAEAASGNIPAIPSVIATVTQAR